MPSARTICALLLLTILAACGDDEEVGCASTCSWPARCDAASQTCTTSCTADGDCGHETLRCDSTGTCISRCAGVLCPTGSLCEPATGTCEADPDRTCVDDASCGDGSMRCEGGVCISRCSDVRCDVEAGEVCNPSTGACVGGTTCSVTDDCAGGKLCEGGICVGDRYANCAGMQPCAAGLVCVGNGEPALCAPPCQAITDCLISDRCATEADGAFAGHCLPNLCRPGGDTFGFYQDAAFMAPCDAAGAGDGICIGPFGTGDQAYGACMGAGSAGTGGTCTAGATHGDRDACAAGVCAGAEDDGIGNCLPFCTLFDDAACPAIGTLQLACHPLWGINGACVPIAANAGSPGEACTLSPTGALACEEESICVPEDGVAGAASICEPLCAPEAAAGGSGACDAGSCQVLPANPALGICVGEGGA